MPYKSKEAQREYYEKNKDKIKEKAKNYREKNKENKKEYNKNYHQENKDKINQQKKEYREENKDKIKEWRKSPAGHKSKMKSNWKEYGVIFDEAGGFEKVYERYLNTTECDVCKSGFDETNKKCLDHDHTTGLFRQILCNRCNGFDSWIKKV